MELTIDEKIDLMDTNNDNLMNKISHLFSSIDSVKSINFPSNVPNDLNIFDDIFLKINKTNTLYGEYTLKKYLSNPIKNISILNQRQQNIKKLLKNTVIFKNVQQRINNIISTEDKILWFWNEVTEDTQSLYDMVYFKLPFKFMDRFLNNNELILNLFNVYKIFLSPIFTIFIPILSLLLPYILLYIFNQKIPFGAFIKFLYNSVTLIPSSLSNKGKYFSIFVTGIYIFLYLQSGYYSVQNAMNTHKIINVLHKKINIISSLVKNVKEVNLLIDQIKLNLIPNVTEDLDYFDHLFNNTTFQNDPKLLSNKGRILSTYHEFLNNKDRLISILQYLGEIDYYIGLCKLRCDGNYCFTRYRNRRLPTITAKKLWHPSLTTNIHTNDMSIGKKNKNLLITGPNRAGKSVFIKSLAIAVVFSQTIVMAPAEEFSMTPFSIINSYLHIPDVTGYASLFEAEMYRAKDHIEMIKRLKKYEHAFIIMDEIFTSTNYVEGYSAAYAIIKKLCNYSNSITIVTTHYTELNTLDKETKISNYRFTITHNKEGEVEYKYKIEPGHSEQYIALELLEHNNFETDIIADAIKVSKDLKDRIRLS